ncbi:MAG: hypothetical protein NC319_05615, partial [Butyricicoccus sp.]|nr:hypothetical protein [Butyricicoccus sp.]
VELLAERGYDPAYGARPLRRTIQSLVEDRVAEKLLEGELKSGGRAEVDVCGGELTLVCHCAEKEICA